MTKTNIIKLIATSLVILLVLTLSVFADGYKPFIQQSQTPNYNNINVPGTISTNLFTGSASYTYPIEVPTGVKNLQPLIFLYYNHEKTAPIPSLLGHGWYVNLNYISRDTKYTRSDNSDDFFILNFNGESYKLVYVPSEKRYHTKTESYLYIEKKSGENNQNKEYWLVKTKEGIVYRFGYNDNSELVSNLEKYTSRWNLDQITDTYGNKIEYLYTENSNGDEGVSYLNEINYGANKIKFNYVFDILSPRKSFLNGNKVLQRGLLEEIDIRNNNKLVKRYTLEYEKDGAYVFVKKIILTGADGTSKLPPTVFEYFKPQISFEKDDSWKLPTYFGKDEDKGVRLLDKNNDGLADVIKVDDSGTFYYWLNNGYGWGNSQQQSGFLSGGFIDDDGNDMGARFLDINNDGKLDILKLVTGDVDKRILKVMGNNGEWVDAFVNNIPSTLNFIYYDDDIPDVECPSGYAPEDDFSCNEYNGECELNCYKYNCMTDDGDYVGSCTGSKSCCPDYTTPVKKKKDVDYDYDEFIISDDQGVRVADVNSDGYYDFVVGKGNSRYTLVNKDSSSFASSDIWTIPIGAEFVNSHSVDFGVQLVDVNGDSLIDIVKGNGYSTSTWLNNGAGWVYDSEWQLPSGTIFINENEKKGVTFADLNGDSLIDIVKSSDSYKSVWINNGNGWSYSDEWSTNIPYSPLDDYTTNLIDINGDSCADVVYAKDSSSKSSWINKAAKSYLLKKVSNLYGGEVTFDYKKSTSLDNTGSDSYSDIGYNVWVIESVNYNNGMEGAHQVVSEYNYDYSGGVHDFEDKEFRGFNFVEETQPDGSRIKHYYHQDDGKKGMEYKTEISDTNNNPYKKIENEFSSTEKNGYYIVKLDSTKEYTYDGQIANPTMTQTEYKYDDYGNIIKTSSKGDTSASGDERYGYNEYKYNTDEWIVDKPSKTHVMASDDSTKVREIYYTYNEFGDVIKEEQWSNTGNNPKVDYTYDNYGNVISETDANKHKTTYEYDTTHTFVTKETNAKNQETKYEYDLGTGNLLSETDPNGYKTEYKYDTFGRKIKEILPYDSESSPTVEYIYEFDGKAPEKMIIKQKENEKGTLDNYEYYDGFDNTIQIKSESEDSKFITTDKYYDAKGRLNKESTAYYSSSKEYTSPDNAVKKIEYTYDVLDRKTKIKNPDNTDVEMKYDKWTTSVYDENDHKKDYVKDAYDNIVEVKEYNGNKVYKTTYNYNAAGDLIKITDDKGNQIKYTYDSLGRKIKLEDSDLGIWEYVYDAGGILIKQTENNLNEITMKYDELDRLSEKSSDGEIFNYTYDKEVIGTLSELETPVMAVSYDYDKRLRTIGEEKVINGEKFNLESTYDSMDRVTSETTPDDTTYFTYNSQGEIGSIGNVVTGINYNELNEPTKRTYKNELTTEMSYHPENKRLTNLKTSSLQDLNYIYDEGGNVISIDDKKNNLKYSMEYDGIDRLTLAEKTGISDEDYDITYTYDSIGNMLKIDSSGVFTGTLEFVYSGKPVHSPDKILATGITVTCEEKFVFKPYCKDGNIYQEYQYSNCNKEEKLLKTCESGCENGECIGSSIGVPDIAVEFTGDTVIWSEEPYVVLIAHIVNKGNGIAENVEWRVISENGKIIAESSTPIKEIKPNEEMFIYPSFNIDCSSQKYIFEVDPYNIIEESNENNNKEEVLLDFICKETSKYKPDLVVKSFEWDTILWNDNEKVVFLAEVANEGDKTAKNVEWSVISQTGNVMATSGSFPIQEIKPNEKYFIYPTFNFDCNSDLYTFKIDPEDILKESNEDNNQLDVSLYLETCEETSKKEGELKYQEEDNRRNKEDNENRRKDNKKEKKKWESTRTFDVLTTRPTIKIVDIKEGLPPKMDRPPQPSDAKINRKIQGEIKPLTYESHINIKTKESSILKKDVVKELSERREK